MYFFSIPRKSWILVVFVSQIAFGAGSTSTADVLKKSSQLIDEKRYEEAISLLESNRAQTAQQTDECSEALILNLLGVAYQRQGKYVAARNAFDGSISRLTRVGGKDTPDLVDPLNNLANLLYESDQRSQAEVVVRRSLAILTATGPDQDIGSELAILAKMYLGERKIQLAQESAEKSLKVLGQAGHQQDLIASIAWSVLGSVYDLRGDGEHAEESLKNSLSVLQRHLNADDYRVAEGIANLGLLYANRGLREKAEPLLEQAHASLRAHGRNTTFVRDFLLVWADMERKSGHKRKGKDLIREAKNLTADSPEEAMSRHMVDANAFR